MTSNSLSQVILIRCPVAVTTFWPISAMRPCDRRNFRSRPSRADQDCAQNIFEAGHPQTVALAYKCG